MTRKESKEKRINDILDAAIPEFVEKGYEGASMESIAARAGLTKGGLYYHVKNKDDILIMANDRFMEPIIRFMGEAMNAASAAVGLAGYIRNYLTYWTKHPTELSFVFLIMTKTLSDSSLRSHFRGYTGQMVAFFEGLYRKGFDSGELKPMGAHSAALSLMGALDGIAGYLVVDDDLDLENTIRELSETFIPINKE